jgi:hypothetical protein
MAQDTRMALRIFIASLEKHFEAVATRRSQEDPSVQTAYLQVEDAFLNYEELLAENFEEYLPFELAEDDAE